MIPTPRVRDINMSKTNAATKIGDFLLDRSPNGTKSYSEIE